MEITYGNFIEKFVHCHKFEPHLFQKHGDVGGGTISIEDIDKINEYPDADVVTVSGLHQDTFEYFIKTYGHRFRAIRFFKNKLVHDWSLLGTLPNLEYIYWFFNQRITSFWDMSENHALKGIYLDDFSRLKNIEGIEKAPNLEVFGVGNAVWDKAEIDSFEPLRNSSVRKFVFSGKKILDTDFSFTAHMKNLEDFIIPSSTLTTEQFAWIAANCPKLKGELAEGVSRFEWYDEWDNDNRQLEPWLCALGKGKRSFRLRGNEEKAEMLLADFEEAKARLKGAPYPI